jgi:hypothetical protein
MAMHGKARTRLRIAAAAPGQTCAHLRPEEARRVMLVVAILPSAAEMSRMRKGVTAGR